MTGEQIKVLVLENDPADALLIQDALQPGQENASILTTVAKFEEGLVHLGQARYDAVLLDPGATNGAGPAALEHVQQHAPQVPVIVLCASGNEQQALRALRAGAQDCLFKNPGSLATAARTIRHAIERHRLSQSLRESERNFSRAFRSSPVAQVISLVEEGTILDANQAYCSLLGYAYEEMVGHSALALGIWADMQDRQNLVRQLRADGRAHDLEIILRTRSGKMRTTLISAEMIEHKGIQCMISTALDISERKLAELNLSERIKELACLSEIRHAMGLSLSLEQLCEQIIQNLISAMQFPEITVPVIQINGKRFCTAKDDLVLSHGLHAEIAVKGKVRGHVRVYYTEDRAFLQPYEQDLVDAISEEFSLWLERSEAEEQLEQRANDLELIHSLNQAANRGDDLQQIISLMSGEIRRIFGCMAVLTCLPNAEKTHLTIQKLDFPSPIASQLEKLLGRHLADLPLQAPLTGQGYFAQAARTGQAKIINDSAGIQSAIAEFANNRLLKQIAAPAYQMMGIRGVMLVPLMAEDEIIGLLDLNRQTPFSGEDLERIQVIAGQVTGAIGRRSAEQALRLSEEKYRSLVEGSDAIIAMLDGEGTIHHLNGNAAKFLEMQAETAIGKSLYDVLQPEWAGYFMEIVRKVIQSNEGQVIEVEVPPSWFRTSTLPVHNAEGKVVMAQLSATDITELKTAQQSLLELNRTLEKRVQQRTAEVQDLYDNAPCGYHSLDAAGNFVMINQTELNWLGYPREEEIIGHNIGEFLTEGSLAPFAVSFPEFKRRGWLKDLELEFVRKDGSILPVLVSATAVYGESGQYLMSRSTVFDNTERKKAEVALRASEETYRTLFDGASDAIFWIDMDSNFVRVNPRCRKLLGLDSDEEILGQKTVAFIDPEQISDAQARQEQLLTEGCVAPYERTFRHKDGTKIETEVTLALMYDSAGKPSLIQSMVRDVTQRKQAENALRESEAQNRLLFEESPDAIALLDDSGRILRANRAYEQLTQIPRHQMIGKTAEQLGLVTSEGRQQLQAAIEEAMQKGETFTSAEAVLACADGNLRNVENRIFLLQIDGRDHILVTGRDVSARKQAEETLRRANIEMERAIRVKDEFLASMSHELRTPLTGILGLSEAMQYDVYGELNEKQKNALANIESSGRHLLDLINDILDVSKIEAGKLELQFEPCALSDICQASLQLVKGMAHKKRHNVSFFMNPASITVMGDARRLKQILVNLLSNAVKYSPEDSSIGLEVIADEAGESVAITAWDTGIGIAAEDLDKLFKPFVQLDSSLAREQTGTGLGLALVQRLADLHRGSIYVESTPGRGSRFTVTLPCLPAKPAPASPESAAPPIDPRDTSAESDEAVAEQLTRYLKILGIEATIYPSGIGAVEDSARKQPGVILLDLRLPDLSGWEVLAQLKADERTRSIPVIVIPVVNDREQAIQMGAADCLAGHFTLPDLQAALEQALQISQGPGKAALVISSQARLGSIMLVDDNELNIFTLSDFLEAQNFQVVAVQSGYDFLEKAPQILPDIVLMDIQMPGMDGLETIRRLRAHADPRLANIPVIAVTALAMPGDRQRCLEAGANEYISKPVRLGEMNRLIRRTIFKS